MQLHGSLSKPKLVSCSNPSPELKLLILPAVRLFRELKPANNLKKTPKTKEQSPPGLIPQTGYPEGKLHWNANTKKEAGLRSSGKVQQHCSLTDSEEFSAVELHPTLKKPEQTHSFALGHTNF